ncbi:MAG: cytochrome c3 family protein [Desulfobacterales bacterium]|nr:cytochrome c3 family protein [Desulfobacterales bacterium]MBF0397229.1 cytochrome c3 family protein [Desulfobacterales bacterium]
MHLKGKILIVASIVLFITASIFAGTQVPDVIKMENKAYPKHEKGIVNFTHKKHAEDYKIGCGECHHDEAGKPLTSLKAGDNVKSCIECHKNPSMKPKGSKLEDKERRAYHAEAIHDNCKVCHQQHNKKNNLKTGDKGATPTTCNACHGGGAQ